MIVFIKGFLKLLQSCWCHKSSYYILIIVYSNEFGTDITEAFGCLRNPTREASQEAIKIIKSDLDGLEVTQFDWGEYLSNRTNSTNETVRAPPKLKAFLWGYLNPCRHLTPEVVETTACRTE